jgi:hypothetical protein
MLNFLSQWCRLWREGDWLEKIGRIFPTRAVYDVILDRIKKDCRSSIVPQNRCEIRREVARMRLGRWRRIRFQMGWANWMLTAEVVCCASLFILAYVSRWYSDFWVVRICAVVGTCRVAEIIYAYGRDVHHRLGDSTNSALTAGQRAILSMKSYISLAMNWALIYSVMNDGCFSEPSPTANIFFSHFYFSVMTITTTGYGDVAPICWPARLFAMIEVLSGVLVIVIAFATYLSAGGSTSYRPRAR